MKPTISLCVAFVALLFVACQSDKKPTTTQGPAPTPMQPLTAPTVATAGVQHYICPNNCVGSGAAQAGTCPTCGTAYAHNAAFHNQPGNNAGNPQLPSNSPSPIIMNPQPTTPQPTTTTTTIQNPQTPATAEEPAQNAAGVWHYTCSKGCAGGSGTRGMCAKCGAGLDHNVAYHK